jgi:transcriptional regulator with XRE-family HTH domain
VSFFDYQVFLIKFFDSKSPKFLMALQTTIAQRFTDFLTIKNFSQKIFSDVTGISSATVSNIASGATEFPKADFFQAIAKHFPEVSLRWLLLGEGKMMLEKGEIDKVYVAREPEELPVSYRGQGKSVEQLSATLDRLSVMLTDCIEEKERMRKALNQ